MKTKVSQILKQKRDWISTKEDLPEPGEKVVIRMSHKTNITGEDENYIYPLEDVCIGILTPRIGDGEDTWMIAPPYPRFDYSPLSTKGVIHSDVEVTHWAIPVKNDKVDELEGWNTRYDRIREYEHLSLEIDPKNEEDVYRALLWAGSYMASCSGDEFHKPDSDIRKFYEIICDLQNSIDSKDWSE